MLGMTNTDELVYTKHGMKARLVTPAQERELDVIANDVFTNPIARVNVHNEAMHNIVVVYTTDGENRTASHIISTDGVTAPL